MKSETVIKHSGIIKLTASDKFLPGDNLPDLTGLSKREILPLIAIPGISVTIDGEGWVVRQDPAPGTPISEGMTIHLELE